MRSTLHAWTATGVWVTSRSIAEHSRPIPPFPQPGNGPRHPGIGAIDRLVQVRLIDVEGRMVRTYTSVDGSLDIRELGQWLAICIKHSHTKSGVRIDTIDHRTNFADHVKSQHFSFSIAILLCACEKDDLPNAPSGRWHAGTGTGPA